MPDRRPVRIVHTSDVHLGAYHGHNDVHGAVRRHLMEEAFRRVIDLGIDSGAQVLLIAGDFFDNDRIPGEVVEFAADQSRRFPGRAFLLPGNHDPMDPGKVYWRHDLEAMAPNLTIFRAHAGASIEVLGHDLVLWGRAYLDSDLSFRPLEGLPERQDGRWHVAMAHGHFVPHGGENHRSLPIHEREIESASGHWDYLAFGHWEPHADVSAGGVTAIYSGAPMALSDANRRAGWAALVDLTDDGVSWDLRRVDPRGGGNGT